MRKEDFFEVLGELDDDIVKGAKIPMKKKMNWKIWGTMAACLCLVICVAAIAPMLNRLHLPKENNGLMMLTIPDIKSNAMGFEGQLGYDITEWDNGNPWSESMELSALPVYKNGSYNAIGIPVGLTQEAMMEQLENSIAALDLENYDIEMEQEQLTASTDEIKIVVYADGLIDIWFEDGLTLPGEYNFTYYDTTDVDAEQVLDYLSQKYSDLLSFSNPQKVLSGSYIIWNDYDENGNYITAPKYEREYILYDSDGDDLENILNYNYNYAKFYPDDNGNLSLIRIYNGLSCAEKLGDYPIISIDSAYELLLNGNYITSVPYAITNAELICKAELVYRNSAKEETFLPYYRFYVELPDMRRENGLIGYGAYYVPAIRAEYITNMPLWNGSIN